MPFLFIELLGQIGCSCHLLFCLSLDFFGGLGRGWISLAHHIDFTTVLRVKF
jgi:hypothetical protein